MSWQPSYQEVFRLVEQLSPEEQVRLVVEIRERFQGFGLWQNRPDIVDPELYVLHLREEEVRKENGELKTREEYLAEITAWDE